MTAGNFGIKCKPISKNDMVMSEKNTTTSQSNRTKSQSFVASSGAINHIACIYGVP